MSYWAKKLEELLTVEREKERTMEKMISREQALAEIEAANDEFRRDELITKIEGLYPTDSQFSETNEIGKKLLDQARQEVENKNWRDLPIEILKRYAELCEDQDYASYVSSRETYND